MRFLVQRQLPDRDGAADDPAPPMSPPVAPATWPMVIWLADGPVCVSIVEAPQYSWHDNACRCGGCRGSIEGDWAERFLP
jgi:hypothetical protein